MERGTMEQTLLQENRGGVENTGSTLSGLDEIAA